MKRFPCQKPKANKGSSVFEHARKSASGFPTFQQQKLNAWMNLERVWLSNAVVERLRKGHYEHFKETGAADRQQLL
ncbi:MAG: hypothetical protein Q7S65_05520 [Nanoarchaeota archaeon]|nr:hypothetical protein [Nanoarchaeota archaeon]